MSIRDTTRAARREWRLAANEPRVILTLFVATLLTLLALGTGTYRTQLRLERQQAIERDNAKQRQFLESAFDEDAMFNSPKSGQDRADEDRQLALQMSARSPDLMRFTGGLWTTSLPVSSFAGLSMGAAGDWPDHYRHGGSSVSQTLTREMRPNPLLAVTGAYDMTLLVGIILPLAVLILTFDVAAADREHGRWALLQTHCRSVPRLIGLRCLVRTGVLAVVVGALLVLWNLVFSVDEFDATKLTHLATLCGWLFAYLAFWGAVAFLVASFRFSSAGSGLAMLLCWAVLVLVVPSIIQNGLEQRTALPGSTKLAAIENEARELTDEELDSIWDDYLQQHPGVQLDDDNPQQEFLLRDIAKEHAVRSRIDEQLQSYFGRFLNREARVDQSQLLTPAIAWRTVADQYSGNSVRHYVDFTRATADFHRDYIRYFEPMTLAGRELSRADIQSLPTFNGQPLARRLYLSPLMFAGLSIFIWTIICIAIGWTRLANGTPTLSRQPPQRSN